MPTLETGVFIVITFFHKAMPTVPRHKKAVSILLGTIDTADFNILLHVPVAAADKQCHKHNAEGSTGDKTDNVSDHKHIPMSSS